MIRSIVVLISIFALQSALRADDKPAKSAEPKSLDEQLLDDLEGDLLDNIPAPTGPTDEPEAGGEEESSELDKDLERKFGEDIGEAPEDDPVAQIGRKMQIAQKRIAGADSSKKTQELQREIVGDLDQLIDDIRKRMKKSQQSSASGSKGSQRSKTPQPGQQAGRNPNEGRTSDRPAADSSERLGAAEDHKVDMEAMQELLKSIWGDLPDRERERMLQLSVEEFLPEYSLMLEKYFRRLAEEPRE